MDYEFDCSQFVATRNPVSEVSEDIVNELTSHWGSDVLVGTNIPSIKRNYLRIIDNLSGLLFEFVDEEFQGEFENWEFISEIPDRVKIFAECTDILKHYNYEVLSIYVVQTPTKDKNRIYETSASPLAKGLYCKSLSYYGPGAGCETLIVRL